jgi:pimeloyl-ACP methyl ester carboxylesterase
MNQLKFVRTIIRIIVITVAAMFIVSVPVFAQDATAEATASIAILPNIVLVHGAWADGSSWSGVIKELQADGYNVTAPQFPLSSLQANEDRLKEVLGTLNGPTILVGHSYGGQIISALGAGDTKVVGLVYIAAFGLDEGETIGGLLAQGAPTSALAHLVIDAQGNAWLPQDDFVNHFAADVDPVQAKVMWSVQQPLSASALADVMPTPTWKSVPSWYMVATKDEAIPPDVERLFAKRMGATVVEVESSHVAMVSHPDDVTKLIEQAATSVKMGS